MSRVELYAISYVVLGLVARDGPVTSYGLKQAMARGFTKLWRFPHTQLYTEPVRLAEAGLLDEEQEPAGRRRRLYTITPSGREALEAWFATGPVESLQLRDEAMMRLYFGAFASPDGLGRVAAERAAFFRAEHERLREAEVRLEARRDRAHQLAVLRFGLRFTELGATFWDEVARDPTCGARPAPGAGPRGALPGTRR